MDQTIGSSRWKYLNNLDASEYLKIEVPVSGSAYL